ncbi:MAG: DUF6671 family protein [Bacteroidota bacterium]
MFEVKKYFKGRSLLIATRHGKEKVMAPILRAALGVKCFTSDNVDSDIFGTFTGEIPRADGAVETLRNKCRYFMEKCGADLAIASEGSFGPHPNLIMLPADEEWVILIDDQNGFEIMARTLSTATNYSGMYVDNFNDLTHFAYSVSFPSHALILRDKQEGNREIVKGITDASSLSLLFERMKKKYDRVFVETDMRAMYNPMRMQVIAEATEQLIQKILHVCPSCASPGYDVVHAELGLPCEICSLPTKSVLRLQYACKKCHHQSSVVFPNQKQKENPMYCDHCNP